MAESCREYETNKLPGCLSLAGEIVSDRDEHEFTRDL
jgi:hypothetical protein